MSACFACLRRSWLIAALGPQLDHFRFNAVRLAERLSAADARLLTDTAGPDLAELRARYSTFDASWIGATGQESAVCLHDEMYPSRLRRVRSAPPVLYASSVERLAGLRNERVVAIAGARDPTEWEATRAALAARTLASTGIAVVGGIGPGVVSTALEAALGAGKPPVAVTPCGPDVPYPARATTLVRRLGDDATIASELRPSTRKHAWAFSGRHRIVTGLADALVVIEGTRESGARAVARVARSLNRPVLVVSALADEASPVLSDGGARAVRSTRELLDVVWNLGESEADSVAPAVLAEPRVVTPCLEPALAELLALVAQGANTVAALAERGLDTTAARSGLARLEIMGRVSRAPNGTYLAA